MWMAVAAFPLIVLVWNWIIRYHEDAFFSLKTSMIDGGFFPSFICLAIEESSNQGEQSVYTILMRDPGGGLSLLNVALLFIRKAHLLLTVSYD